MLTLLFLAGVGIQAQESADSASPAIIDESALVLDGGDAPEEDLPVTPLSTFGVWDFIRMVFVLAIVVVLIYGVFHFIKKAGAPRDDGMRFIRVLETRPLAAGRHLHLVEVGTQILLVGSAESGVGLVSEVSDKETLDGIHLAASRMRPRAGSFAGALMGFLGRRGQSGADGSADGGEGSPDFMRKQKERLKKLL